VFLTANNHPAAAIGKGKLEKLTQNVLLGIHDPKLFADKTGFKQMTDQTQCSSLAWIEPLHTAFPTLCMTQSLARCRPMLSTRMGGNMTTLFANNTEH
jgi:poly(beta-D-mannuronate) lyase